MWLFFRQLTLLGGVNTMSDAIGYFFLVALMIFLYYIPAMVADDRDHPQKDAILTMNAVLGWTFIFWGLALTWAMMKYDD